MKNFRRLLFVLLIVAMAVSIFTGCVSSSKDNPQSGNSGANEGTDPKELEGGTGDIVFWMHVNDSFNSSYQKFIDEYLKDNEKAKIDLQIFPYEVLEQKTKAAYAAGTEADVIQGFGSWFRPIIKNDLVSEVPAELSAYFESQYFSSALNGFKYDEKYYAVPNEVNVEYGLFYKEADLKAAGVTEIPATFGEFLEIAKKMTVRNEDGTITKAGFDFYNSDGTFFLFFDWILQQGGSYIAEDGVHLDITTPEAENVFKLMQDMSYGDNAVTDFKRTTAQLAIEQLFIKDQSASVMKGPWVNATFVDNKVEGYKYAVLPPAFGDKPLFVVEPGWGMIVSNRSENKKLAWDFIKYATTSENAEIFATNTSTIPAIEAVNSSEDFLNIESNVPIRAAFEMMEDSRAIGPVIETAKVKEIISKYVLRLSAGADITESLASAEKEINDYYDSVLD